MIPQTRTDLFLAKITGEDVTLPVPQTRFELYLANIAGESYELPAPNSRATLYLAKILGQDVDLPVPQTRSELYLASIAGMSVQLPSAPTTREEWYLARWAEDAAYVTITGNPVSFSAVAAKLRQLKIAFSPVQEGSGDPSPENERPIHGWTGVNVWDDPYYAGLIQWNQILKNANFADSSVWYLGYGQSATLTIADGVATIDIIADTSSPAPYFRQDTAMAQLNHVYLIWASVKYSKAVDFRCEYGGGGAGQSKGPMVANEWNEFQFLFKRTTSPTSNTLTFYPVQSQKLAGEFWQIKDTAMFDLTQMFGSAKADEILAMETAEAGSGVAYFRSLFPSDYYAYNAGTETTAGAVNGDPGWLVPVSFPDGETYYSGWVDPTTGDGLATGDLTEITTADAIHSAGTNPAGFFRVRYINKGRRFVNHGDGLYNVGTVNTATNAYNYSQPNKAFVETDSIYIMPPATVTTRDEYLAWLAEVGTLQVFFSLNEPIPFHVDPQQINSLAGANNMWTDADTLTVEYRKDGNVSDAEALGILLGGRYTPATGPEDVPDSEALSIITGR